MSIFGIVEAYIIIYRERKGGGGGGGVDVRHHLSLSLSLSLSLHPLHVWLTYLSHNVMIDTSYFKHHTYTYTHTHTHTDFETFQNTYL